MKNPWLIVLVACAVSATACGTNSDAGITSGGNSMPLSSPATAPRVTSGQSSSVTSGTETSAGDDVETSSGVFPGSGAFVCPISADQLSDLFGLSFVSNGEDSHGCVFGSVPGTPSPDAWVISIGRDAGFTIDEINAMYSPVFERPQFGAEVFSILEQGQFDGDYLGFSRLIDSIRFPSSDRTAVWYLSVTILEPSIEDPAPASAALATLFRVLQQG